MSSAFYPLGMKSYNNHTPQGGYKTWKGDGVNSFPVGITATTLRPFTNKDYTNNFKTGFGLPRPIKHYRLGRGFNYNIETSVNGVYSIHTANKAVKSSNGGATLVGQLIDVPGAYNVFENKFTETGNKELLESECLGCQGVGMVVNYKPNLEYLTNNPEPTTENKTLCCNEEKKAEQRVIYASTNLKKNYYTTHAQYMQNRCKLYNQRVFNFKEPVGINDSVSKPGSPLAVDNIYMANCQCNSDIQQATEYALVNKLVTALLNNGYITQSQLTAYSSEAGALVYPNNKTIQGVYNWIQTFSEPKKSLSIIVFNNFVNNPYWGIPATGPVSQKSCNLVVYKPNNYQYAQQGAVSSSTRMLKLNVNTITKNAASFKKKNINYSPAISYNSSNNPFILKSKVEPCNPSYFAKNGNPKTCPALAPVSSNKMDFNSGRNGYKTFVQNVIA